jgi:hypothetical protein
MFRSFVDAVTGLGLRARRHCLCERWVKEIGISICCMEEDNQGENLDITWMVGFIQFLGTNNMPRTRPKLHDADINIYQAKRRRVSVTIGKDRS